MSDGAGRVDHGIGADGMGTSPSVVPGCRIQDSRFVYQVEGDS